ncbi:hypothetical protein CS0771_64380 [Catellatospora sp. IY07-71]|uniref:DUF3558 family protein n=1 Tax=Catellatospora sp. IY07-71 TaxID=2728827 RepID=UPI001BB3E671|nr:DUF3558 family protein [Catellatospora sp. IY07-71]BCJ76894.1 hypothetical protein CS0771_64380 [Catellatospora sp. IY07-71]
MTHALRRTRTLAVLALLGSLALTACGPTGGEPAAGPPVPAASTPPASAAAAPGGLPDLCTLLTAGAVADAAGTDIPFHRAEPGPGIISCAYHLGADDATPAIFVQYQTGAAGILDFTNSGEETRIGSLRAKWYERGAKLNVAVGEDLLIVNLGVSNKNLRGGDLRALAVELAERSLDLIR